MYSIDHDNTEKKQYCSYKIECTGLHKNNNSLYIYDDTLKMFDIYNPTIYYFNSDKKDFIPEYEFNFNGKYISEKDLCDFDKFIETSKEQTFITDNFVEGDKYVFYLFVDKGVHKSGFFNKKTKRNKTIDKISGNTTAINWPKYFHNGYMYSFIEAEWLFSDFERNKTLIEKLKVGQTSNPILVKYKFKEL